LFTPKLPSNDTLLLTWGNLQAS